MLAIIGAVALTLLACVVSYVIFAFFALVLGFSDTRPSNKLGQIFIAIVLIFAVWYGWFLLVGTNIHLSFG